MIQSLTDWLLANQALIVCVVGVSFIYGFAMLVAVALCRAASAGDRRPGE